MKTFLTVLTTCLVLLTVGTLSLLGWQFHQSRELAEVNHQLTQELRQSKQTVEDLTGEKAAVSEMVATMEAREEELRARVESLEQAGQTAAEALPQPYRVRAFLGQDNLGGAWIIPHNVKRDPESGRYIFEPVLVVDESAKNHFTVHHTNVVEREVYTTEYYDGYNRYPYYYAYGTPGRPGATNRPPDGTRPPSQPRMQVNSQPQQPDARARLFAPPLSIVNSRPQVIGTPATSPVNARVFAP